MGFSGFLNNFYSGDYKRYMIVPASLLVIFLFLIFVFPTVKQGIDLKGGTNIMIRADKPLEARPLYNALISSYTLTDLQINPISSPAGYGLFIQYSENTPLVQAKSLLEQSKASLTSDPQRAIALARESVSFSSQFSPSEIPQGASAQEAVAAAEGALVNAGQAFDTGVQNIISQTYGLGPDLKYQKTIIGPSLGKAFYSLGLQVMLMGLFLLSLVIFLYFREILTSVTVIGAAVFNIIGALAFMALLSIPVSLTTIPALLMLIGYSVDTEIVMSSRVLKRKETTAKQRMNESLITILTMGSTAAVAVGIMALLSYFAQINVIFDLSIVLFFGLLADLISSTMLNAPLILSQAEKEEGHA
ncbi:MAG TPA: hypothetical protein HA254_02505 [Candidatus Diapherotrites archaeon]|uniref:Protein-export membrane protein SecF n=1 Tax=Candidatus Iainarchaeum sp. TaxID=3101447 RepID=A0A7J4IZ25_9ARCH|nr:hypothetical protein [Candidatus Diapherotrites archaeon]